MMIVHPLQMEQRQETMMPWNALITIRSLL